MGCGIQVLTDWLTLAIGVWIYKHINLTYFNQAFRYIIHPYLRYYLYITFDFLSFPSFIGVIVFPWIVWVTRSSLDCIISCQGKKKTHSGLTEHCDTFDTFHVKLTGFLLSLWRILDFALCAPCCRNRFLSFLLRKCFVLTFISLTKQNKKQKKKDQQKQGKSNK